MVSNPIRILLPPLSWFNMRHRNTEHFAFDIIMSAVFLDYMFGHRAIKVDPEVIFVDRAQLDIGISPYQTFVSITVGDQIIDVFPVGFDGIGNLGSKGRGHPSIVTRTHLFIQLVTKAKHAELRRCVLYAESKSREEFSLRGLFKAKIATRGNMAAYQFVRQAVFTHLKYSFPGAWEQ